MEPDSKEKLWLSSAEDSPEPLGLKVPASSEYVLLTRLVVAHVGQAAGFGPEEIYDLKLAVTEAVTNVIRHAKVDMFEIEYLNHRNSIEITVTDSGEGFDSDSCESPKLEDGIEGGLGLSVIRNLVDMVDIESSPGKTSIRMMSSAGAYAKKASSS